MNQRGPFLVAAVTTVVVEGEVEEWGEAAKVARVEEDVGEADQMKEEEECESYIFSFDLRIYFIGIVARFGFLPLPPRPGPVLHATCHLDSNSYLLI